MDKNGVFTIFLDEDPCQCLLAACEAPRRRRPCSWRTTGGLAAPGARFAATPVHARPRARGQ
eukprot:12421596-Heterocapsa_arctica.AAC.1